MRRAVLASLLLVTVAHAQLPSFRPLRVSACAPAHVVLTRPDGSTLAERLHGEFGAREMFDWWNGPGVYRLDASVRGRQFSSSFRTYATEVDVDALVGCPEGLRARVAVGDARVAARLIHPGWELEVRNDTDVALEAHAQAGHLHYEIDAVDLDPSASLDDRRARSSTTDIWCGTGLRPLVVPAHQTIRAALSSVRGVHARGRYRGTVRLDAPDGHETFVTFEFSVSATGIGS